MWSSNASTITQLVPKIKSDVSAKDYGNLWWSGYLLVPWGWPLNENSTVINSSNNNNNNNNNDNNNNNNTVKTHE